MSEYDRLGNGVRSGFNSLVYYFIKLEGEGLVG